MFAPEDLGNSPSKYDPYYSKKIGDFCQGIQAEDRGKVEVKVKVKEKKGWRSEERGRRGELTGKE
jgi:hypothetical protein